MPTLQRTIIFSLGLLLVLAACNQTNNQQTTSALPSGQGALTIPSITIHPTETVDAINATLHAQATAFAQSPTLEPAAEATYWADRNRESEYYYATLTAGGPTRTLSPDSADIATAKANGTLLTPYIHPDFATTVGRVTGCFDATSQTVTVSDCWIVIHNSYHYSLMLVTKKPQPDLPLVRIHTQTLQSQDVATDIYSAPQPVGALYVHHTDGAQIYFATVADASTVVLRFNLETRQWLDPLGTVLPSLTPTFTPTATP
ncbi:hypothetical protein [Herpetosiphon llansteffanensis]|uniref:hypothetical protein n=1 Tax=Herpetosiphon llansteffanensis TaxID=2094568 RepID=UPI000F51A922|nr:hypothetical protein [Herpetosiphon llansteffanensis]